MPNLMHFWDSYSNLIADASGGLNDVWSNNTYNWSGPGGWRFSVAAIRATKPPKPSGRQRPKSGLRLYIQRNWSGPVTGKRGMSCPLRNAIAFRC